MQEVRKIKLFEKDAFKVFLLIYFAISRPFFIINSFLFYMVTLILLLLILLYIDVTSIRKKFDDLMEWAFYILLIPWLQVFVIFAFIIGLLVVLEGSKYSNSTLLIITLCWMISLITLIYVCRNIYSIIKKIRELAIEEKLFNKGIILLTCLSIIMIFIAPDVAFSIGYSLFLATFKDIILSNMESLYLSMIISNTLPVGETFSKYITAIGDTSYIYTFQMLHIFINKIISWIIVGIIFNYFFLAINIKRI